MKNQENNISPNAVAARRTYAAVLLLVLLLPMQSVCGYEVDTTRVRTPVKKELSFGRKLLRGPRFIIRAPVYAVEGVVGVIVNDVIMTKPAGQLKMMLSRVERPWGIYPVVGYGSNSGLKGGLAFTSKDVFTKGERLKIKATYSTHDYQRYSLSYRAPNKFGSFKRPHVDFAYRKRPRESFYGLGDDTRERDEVAFTLEKTEFALGWHHELYPSLRLNLDGGYRALNVSNGRDPDLEGDLATIADSLNLPSESMRSVRVWSVGAAWVHDWRDHPGQPSSGGEETIGVSYNKGTGRSHDLEYVVTTVDLRHYLNVFKKRLLVLRLLAEAVDRVGDAPEVPFYLRRNLGGKENLRGYRTRRFVDNDLALASVEYRWPVWLLVDAFLFMDQARVFNSIDREFGFDGWRWSAGGGLRVWSSEGVIVSTTIAFSDEGTRFYLQIGDAL